MNTNYKYSLRDLDNADSKRKRTRKQARDIKKRLTKLSYMVKDKIWWEAIGYENRKLCVTEYYNGIRLYHNKFELFESKMRSKFQNKKKERLIKINKLLKNG